MLGKNFGAFPPEFSSYQNSKIVILPAPYDGTSTWIKGADRGPHAIIDASPNMEFYDMRTRTEVCGEGIFTDKPILVVGNPPPEKILERVAERVGYHISNGKFVVVLGGEHSVSIGAVIAQREKHKKMAVLQLDAHADLRKEYEGSNFNHACVMARIKELCPIVQVGIRSMSVEEEEEIDRKRVFTAEDIKNGGGNWISGVMKKLPKDVYVTLDLDVLDPSEMPATGTPEPGGLSWYDVQNLIREVCKRKNVIGFDVVELCPISGNKAPDFLAARLVYEFLTCKFEKEMKKHTHSKKAVPEKREEKKTRAGKAAKSGR